MPLQALEHCQDLIADAVVPESAVTLGDDAGFFDGIGEQLCPIGMLSAQRIFVRHLLPGSAHGILLAPFARGCDDKEQIGKMTKAEAPSVR